jgi:hypothetical protein
MKGLLKKLLLVNVLMLFWSSIVFAAPLVQVLKQGVTQLDSVFTKVGVNPGTESATQLQNSLDLTIRALNKGKYPKTEAEFKKVLGFDKRLVDILSKDVDDLSDKDIARLINRLTVTAEKESNGPFIMCGACVTDELSDMGILAVTQRVSKSTSKILKSMPKDARAVNRSIKKLGVSLEIKNIDEIINAVPDVEKRRLFVSLSKIKSGTKDEKALGKALLAFLTVGDKVYLPESKLYTIMTDRLNKADMKSWTKTLTDLSKEEPIDSSTGRLANLEKWFEQKAKDNPELEDSLKKLRKKNCWKIFK